MKVDEFIKSSVFRNLDHNVQDLLNNLNEKLGNLDYVIIKRNEPVLVFKVRTMFENKPKSKANIATIRLKHGYITIGPYKNNDENIVECRCKEDITEKLIMDIKAIYQEKTA